MNLDSLRKARVKRKGVKTTAYTGQKHIFNILDRATRKFHGDLGLWMQYIEYARSQKSNKKIQRLLTEVLRMHPTKAEVWIYAARYAMDVQADISAARNYMQRGLRFNQKSKTMYLEYARLEMGYVAKISARRKILGIERGMPEEVKTVEAQEAAEDDNDADMIALPTLTAEDLAAEQDQSDDDEDKVVTSTSKTDPALTPAMTGAIPMAIFDAAMKQFASPPDLAEQFFNSFAVFTSVRSLHDILQHVLDAMLSAAPTSPSTLSCSCRKPLIGLPVDDPAFPGVLGTVLKDIRAALEQTSDKPSLAQKISKWLSALSADDNLAPELRKVVSATLRQLKKETPDEMASG